MSWRPEAQVEYRCSGSVLHAIRSRFSEQTGNSPYLVELKYIASVTRQGRGSGVVLQPTGVLRLL